MFKMNGIENIPEEEFNEHLQYFKEYVLDDRLTYNQTKIVEEVGTYFLALYDLLHCDERLRIRMVVNEFILKNGRTASWKNMIPPDGMTEGEQFYWQIKGLTCWSFDRNRLTDCIPKTPWYYSED